VQYEVNWATGDRDIIEADTPEEAYDLAKEMLPSGGSWVDIDVLPLL
jgi:hypothetical protein